MQRRHRFVFLWITGVILVLTACQGTAPTPSNTTVTEISQATTSGSNNAGAISATSTTAAVTLTPRTGEVCKLYSNPFSQVTEKDWVTGPQDASVTIIEYSDFQ